MNTQATIIGYGTMGQAIAEVLRHSGGIKVFAVGRNTKQDRAAKEIKKSAVVILAVKPQDAKEALGQFKNYFNRKTILISIMAGVPIKKIVSLSEHKKIVRMMPNLGLAVGEGIAVWKSAGLSVAERKNAKNFMDKITENFEVKNEDMINKATAISGSGPAYFFLLAACMLETGQALGFKRTEGKKLVQKTLFAAAKLSQNADYEGLIKQIASKGGTTEAALRTFEAHGLNKIVTKAVRAAFQRAKKLNHG